MGGRVWGGALMVELKRGSQELKVGWEGKIDTIPHEGREDKDIWRWIVHSSGFAKAIGMLLGCSVRMPNSLVWVVYV